MESIYFGTARELPRSQNRTGGGPQMCPRQSGPWRPRSAFLHPLSIATYKKTVQVLFEDGGFQRHNESSNPRLAALVAFWPSNWGASRVSH